MLVSAPGNSNQIAAADIGLEEGENPESDELNLRKVRDEAEKRALIAATARANGNLAKAAEILGVSRPTLYDLMHRFGLK